MAKKKTKMGPTQEVGSNCISPIHKLNELKILFWIKNILLINHTYSFKYVGFKEC